MKNYFYALALVTIVGCTTTPTNTDFTNYQNRAISGIQAAQSSYTQLLLAHQITVEQDQAMQAKFLTARKAVLEATTTAEVLTAAKTVGVTP